MKLFILCTVLLAVCLCCSPGFEPEPGFPGSCLPCPLGRFSFDGAVCLPCAPGTFGNQTQLVECFECPVNTFSDTYESTMCTHCPAGLVAPDPGSTECTEPSMSSSAVSLEMLLGLTVALVVQII